MREDKAADAIGLVELTSPRLQHGDGEVTWVLLIDAVRKGLDTRISLEDTPYGPNDGQRGTRPRRPRVGLWMNPPAHSAPNAARQNHETAMKVSPSITAAIAPICHK